MSKNTDSSDSFKSTIGYCKLAEMVVAHALIPYDHDSALSNIKFGKSSQLVEHYCCVFGYDENRIRNRIVEINSDYLNRGMR